MKDSGDCNQADGNSNNNTHYCIIDSIVFAVSGNCICRVSKTGGTRYQ